MKEILIATEKDIPELLNVQKTAFMPVAQKLNWSDAANITETLEQATEAFPHYTMLKMLNEHFNLQLSDEQLEKYATKLGADCPIFIKNKPVYAEGIGEIFTDIDFSLKGYYLALIKPETFISTKEAFANIHPHFPEHNLLSVYKKPIEEWKNLIVNDFEDSVFPNHPEIARIKESLYEMGAAYASMSGSGSTVYGIFRNPQENLEGKFEGCYCKCLKL